MVRLRRGTVMLHALLVAVALAAPLSPAQQAAQPQSGAQPVDTPSRGCLALKPIGSHAFRNIMLAGVAGALVSKQQYQVVDAVRYPARIGQKLHGNDLQAIGTGGTRVVILDKHYTAEDLHEACQDGGQSQATPSPQ